MFFILIAILTGFSSFTTATAATTYVVNSADDSDDGTCDGTHCSLREAINAANMDVDADVIEFAIPGGGVHTLQLAANLPEVTEAVEIDATTQPGYAGSPLVMLDGESTLTFGFQIQANTTLRGFSLVNFVTAGIQAAGAGNNVIQACYVGLEPDGVTVGTPSDGIVLASGSDQAIGGTLSDQGNVISGCVRGIYFAGPNVTGTVLANLIGTDSSGTQARGNTYGINMADSTFCTLGNSTPQGRNVISGNRWGVAVLPVDAPSNLECRDNFIGTDITGTQPLGNECGILVTHHSLGNVLYSVVSANGVGIWSDDDGAVGVFGSYIGTNSTGDRLGNTTDGVRISRSIYTSNIGTNEIAFNGRHGIYGDDAQDMRVTDNTIHDNGGAGVGLSPGADFNYIGWNSFYGNSGLAVDLGNDGVTPNDDLDADTGSNQLLNFPVLETAVFDGTNTVVSGSYQGLPNKVFVVNLNTTDQCNASGYGGATSFVDVGGLRTDASGSADFSIVIPGPFDDGTDFTAYISYYDLSGGEKETTSEFSRCLTYQTLFSDGFESGDLSAWSAPTFGESSLNVVTGAVSGGFCLEVSVDETAPAFLSVDQVVETDTSSLRFLADFSGAAMAEGVELLVLALQDAGGQEHVRVKSGMEGGNHDLRLSARTFDGVWIETGPVVVNDNWHILEVGLRGSSDGNVTLWVDGLPLASIGLNNAGAAVKTVHWGQVETAPSGTVGSFLLDDFLLAAGRYIGSDICPRLVQVYPEWHTELTILDLVNLVCP